MIGSPGIGWQHFAKRIIRSPTPLTRTPPVRTRSCGGATGGRAVKSLAATLPARTTLEADGALRTEGDLGFSASLLLAIHMARRLFGLTSEEVLLGVTRHAAQALGLRGARGMISPGLAADFAVWSIDSLDELGYWAGFNPCSMVVKDGEFVLERPV